MNFRSPPNALGAPIKTWWAVCMGNAIPPPHRFGPIPVSSPKDQVVGVAPFEILICPREVFPSEFLVAAMGPLKMGLQFGVFFPEGGRSPLCVERDQTFSIS